MEQRTSAEAKDLIERAAHALGVSPSEFVTAAAVREARATLSLAAATHVPAKAGRAFVEAFEREEPAADLVRLMRRHAEVAKGRSRSR